jgi:hypothetical protein
MILIVICPILRALIRPIIYKRTNKTRLNIRENIVNKIHYKVEVRFVGYILWLHDTSTFVHLVVVFYRSTNL